MTAVNTTASAFAAGLVTSLHCAGMCGPLACAWATGRPDGPTTYMRDTSLYHGAKLISYTILGAVAGTLGIMPVHWLQSGPGVIVPWSMVALFLIIGLGLEQRLPKPRVMSLPMARAKLWALRRSGMARAAMLGLATPLIPCGPLYLMFGVAMANGSPVDGAQFALAFGLGTLPLLWLVQTQLPLMRLRMKPHHVSMAQRVMALGAAAVIVWRLRGTFSGLPGATCCH